MAKVRFGFGTPNEAVIKESLGFIEKQLPALEAHLAKSRYLAGSELSIADLYGFAYSENAEMGEISLDAYPAFQKWYAGIKERPAIQRAFKKLGRS